MMKIKVLSLATKTDRNDDKEEGYGAGNKGSANMVRWLRELRQSDMRKGTSKTTAQSK